MKYLQNIAEQFSSMTYTGNRARAARFEFIEVSWLNKCMYLANNLRLPSSTSFQTAYFSHYRFLMSHMPVQIWGHRSPPPWSSQVLQCFAPPSRNLTLYSFCLFYSCMKHIHCVHLELHRSIPPILSLSPNSVFLDPSFMKPLSATFHARPCNQTYFLKTSWPHLMLHAGDYCKQMRHQVSIPLPTS